MNRRRFQYSLLFLQFLLWTDKTNGLNQRNGLEMDLALCVPEKISYVLNYKSHTKNVEDNLSNNMEGNEEYSNSKRLYRETFVCQNSSQNDSAEKSNGLMVLRNENEIEFECKGQSSAMQPRLFSCESQAECDGALKRCFSTNEYKPTYLRHKDSEKNLCESNSLSNLQIGENGPFSGIFFCPTSNSSGTYIYYFKNLWKKTIFNIEGESKRSEILNINNNEQIYVEVGASFGLFTCTFSKFLFFSNEISWKIKLKDGTFFQPKNEIRNKISNVLKVNLNDINDSFEVYCFLKRNSDLGKSLNVSSVVHRSSLPEISSFSKTFVVQKDEDLNLTCTASGFPAPTIEFKYFVNDHSNEVEDLILKTGDSASIDTRKTNITAVKFYILAANIREGRYYCNATNQAGSVFSHSQISINLELERQYAVPLLISGGIGILFLAIGFIGVFIFWKRIMRNYSLPLEEIENFFNGDEKAFKNCKDNSEKASFIPYDPVLFEISFECLNIDMNEKLGEGEFGNVYKAMLDKGCEKTTVAVKMLKRKGISEIVSFLQEIKILAFIGKHENIIEFVGANTENLRTSGEVYLITEYCSLNNLETHLRNNQTFFLNEFKEHDGTNGINPQTSESHYKRLIPAVKTSDLLDWAYQIVNAMEFLSSLNIVHGDLAARNVLLTGDHTVKLNDFGHAKKIYNYKNSYSKSNVKVPWRWYAIEALQYQQTSSMSDVWSFGITLWEMFTLGQVPYNSKKNDSELIEYLLSGNCEKCPAYANIKIYSIMKSCWQLKKSSRPSFAELKQLFNDKMIFFP